MAATPLGEGVDLRATPGVVGQVRRWSLATTRGGWWPPQLGSGHPSLNRDSLLTMAGSYMLSSGRGVSS
jgi:hypothetical protein